jgi:hypothetical protein
LSFVKILDFGLARRSLAASEDTKSSPTLQLSPISYS